MNNEISKMIETKRKEKGLTQAQLAEKLGVSNTAVSKWEHSCNLPDISLLEPISEILDLDILSLLTAQNASNENTIKRNKRAKNINIIVSICIITLFILSLISLNIIKENQYKKEISRIKQEQTEVYRFYSNDSDYFVSGYLIQNNKEQMVILKELSFQGDLLNNYKEVTRAEVTMYNNEKEIFHKNLENKTRKKYELNEMLSRISEKDTLTTKIYNYNVSDENFYIQINIYKNNKAVEKIINLEVSKEI
jgi:transcriptional regulator with XRE-family HTH domain